MDDSKIFISYSRKDSEEFAKRLYNNLVLKGFNVWLDKFDIQPGELWDEAIEKALESSGQFLIILSPESVSSINVRDELNFALDEGKKVIPVLHISCKIPFRIRRRQYCDFTNNYESGLDELLKKYYVSEDTKQSDRNQQKLQTISTISAQLNKNKKEAKGHQLKSNYFIDLHCHPVMKPLAKSFDRKPGVNNNNIKNKGSIWFYDPPTTADKIVNFSSVITKFRQSDFSSQAKSGARIILISLGNIEKGLFVTNLGTEIPGDIIGKLATGLSKKHIDYIQQMPDYFNFLEMELYFISQLEGSIAKIDGKPFTYKIVSSFDEITENDDQNVSTIFIILTIEGCHIFNSGLLMMGKAVDPEEVLTNISKLKNWDKRILFIGLTHHFYNEMVGHTKSLHGLASKFCDQSEGLNEGFSDLGYRVLEKLLDNSDGNRILIDLKHLSVRGREEYYEFLESKWPSENIPLIVSHGAVNGLWSNSDKVIKNKSTYGKFLDDEMNFFDSEIIRIAKSRGIFGIQLDEYRIASLSERKKSTQNLNDNQLVFNKTKLVWNQIQHIAEVLNNNGQFAWDKQAIGSNFDGMNTPLKGCWTSEDLKVLKISLLEHADNYFSSEFSNVLEPYNKITTDEIVDRFMHDNAYEFLKSNF